MSIGTTSSTTRWATKLTRSIVAVSLCTAIAVGMVGSVSTASETPDGRSGTVLEDARHEIASGSATIGFPEIPAPNAQGSCASAVLISLTPIPPDCTLFSASFQAPPGSTTIRQASVRTGPQTGPMRFTILRALRSQAGVPSGIICCTAVAQSQVFTPDPNQVTTIPVSLPVVNRVDVIDGERVEVVDYLAIDILDRNSTLPLFATAEGFLTTSVFLPSVPLGQVSILSGAAQLPIFGGSAAPTISAIACSNDGDSPEAICQTVGNPGTSFTGINPSRLVDTRESGDRVGAGSTTRIQVANAPGVPASAVGAVLNITAVSPQSRGFLTVFPCNTTQPTASNLNYLPGQTVANAAVATLGSTGEVCVFSSTATHLVVDLNGAFT